MILPTFGKITFSNKDLTTSPLRYDKLALSKDGSILMLSVIAEANYIKAIRSILNGGAKAKIMATEGKVCRPDHQVPNYRNPEDCRPTDENYVSYVHRLDYGLCHAMFVTKMDGFMPVFTEEPLWRELQKPRFTTPILREWLPFIRESLYQRDLLRFAESFGCKPGILLANTEQLDEVVSSGVRDGAISIPN